MSPKVDKAQGTDVIWHKQARCHHDIIKINRAQGAAIIKQVYTPNNTDILECQQAYSTDIIKSGRYQRLMKALVSSGWASIQKGGHFVKENKTEEDGWCHRKDGEEAEQEKKEENYGLGKLNPPELWQSASHSDLILAPSAKVLAWVVPRNELELLNGALALGTKALAPVGCVVAAYIPGGLGGIVGGWMGVHFDHLVPVKHGCAAGTDICLGQGFLVAQPQLLEGPGLLMETLRGKQGFLGVEGLTGEQALVGDDTLTGDGVVIVCRAVAV